MRKSILVLLLALTGALAVPQFAGAAEYTTFVGCDDLAEEPIPSHACELGDFPGAYFEADVDTEYEVCIEFPDGEEVCAEEQEAEGGLLYVNSIFSESEGTHLVSWYVEGVEIGSWEFRMDAPPSPPAPPAPAPAPPPAPALSVVPIPTPGPSGACRKARRKVGALKRRMRKVNRSKATRRAKLRQKKQIRIKLKKARATVRRAC